MASRNRFFAISAQQADPLSWLTSRQLSLLLGILVLSYGIAASAITWTQAHYPALQVVAAVLCAAACGTVYVGTRPLLQPIGWRTSVAALLVAMAGMVVSALGYVHAGVALEWWWAPAGMLAVIASLGPSLAANRILVLGVVFTVASAVVCAAILHTSVQVWGPISAFVLIAYPPALGVAVTVTFSYTAVRTILPILESPSRLLVAGRDAHDEVADTAERAMLARLTARAAPFLEGLAESGTVTPGDRALAGQLARRLRDELVTQSNLSWLDAIASTSRLVVVDPDHRASHMNGAQRTALRGLLRAILDAPGADTSSIMVELRKAADGATAVGVNLDMALPEGTRIMFLAPYYLTLKTAVDDLTSVNDGITFRVPDNGDR